MGHVIKYFYQYKNEQQVSAENAEKLKDQYKKMKHDCPAERPSLDASIQFFYAMQRQLSVKERTFRVGLIDVQYLNAMRKMDDNTVFQRSRYNIMEELKCFHHIILIATPGEPDYSLYTEIMLDLSRCGIHRVSHDIYLADFDQNLINYVYQDLCGATSTLSSPIICHTVR